MELQKFLEFMYLGGGGIVVFSWLAEKWAWFQSKSSETKKLITFVSGAVLSIIALSIMTFVPEETMKLLEPYFLLIYGNFAVLFTGQVFHKFNKKEDAVIEDESESELEED